STTSPSSPSRSGTRARSSARRRRSFRSSRRRRSTRAWSENDRVLQNARAAENVASAEAWKEVRMLLDLARNWWIFLLDGACAILFGILTFAWPAITLVVLAFLYGIYAIAHGLLALSESRCKHDTGRPWGRMALVGVVSILSGVLAMAWPGVTA